MGIKGLGKFIGDFAPRAIKRQEAASFASRVVAVDASMSLYQFLVSIRDADSFGTFTNEAGECTSHIAGMLNRALRLLEQGIKPVYVFDGEPPALKAAELAKRRGVREAAAAAAEVAREAGDAEELRKQLVRSLRVDKKHAADVQRLLRLMGLPVVQAPGEAEAQCAELTKHQRVWATATEDADALTFGATRLIRNLTFGGASSDRSGGSSSSSKGSSGGGGGGGGGTSSSNSSNTAAVLLIDLPTLLHELRFTQQQFVDFCILCGCDYCGTIRGVGAKTAYALLRDYGSLEKALESGALESEKLPDPFPYAEVRQLFIKPRVLPAAQIEIHWTDVDADGLRHFLVQENQFNEQRVENYILRLKKARGKASQMRLETFFGVPTTKSSSLMVKQQQERERQLELQRQKKFLPKKVVKKGKRRASPPSCNGATPPQLGGTAAAVDAKTPVGAAVHIPAADPAAVNAPAADAAAADTPAVAAASQPVAAAVAASSSSLASASSEAGGCGAAEAAAAAAEEATDKKRKKERESGGDRKLKRPRKDSSAEHSGESSSGDSGSGRNSSTSSSGNSSVPNRSSNDSSSSCCNAVKVEGGEAPTETEESAAANTKEKRAKHQDGEGDG